MSMIIDASAFSAMVRDLSGNVGASVKRATEFEAGRVLGKCVEKTRASTGKFTRKRQESEGFATDGNAEVWVNTTGKNGSPIGRAWLVEPNDRGKKTCFIIRGPGDMRHWSDQRWALAQSLLAKADKGGKIASEGEAVKRKGPIKGKGLAKASWVQIAAALGLTVSPTPPAYVSAAIPQDGVRRVSGKGRRIDSPEEFILELENVYPLLCGAAKRGTFKTKSGKAASTGLDGASILASALSNRVAYFQRGVESGWFDDVKKIGERYPGIKVS